MNIIEALKKAKEVYGTKVRPKCWANRHQEMWCEWNRDRTSILQFGGKDWDGLGGWNQECVVFRTQEELLGEWEVVP